MHNRHDVEVEQVFFQNQNIFSLYEKEDNSKTESTTIKFYVMHQWLTTYQ